MNNNTITHEYPGLVPVDNEELKIPIFNIVEKDGPLGVDLRELHRELESKQEFSNWAKTKLKHFTQFVDYEPADEIVKRPQGGSYKKKGFFVSSDCAKHIAMMEQTERGKQVRKYFIEVEKRYREQYASVGPQTYLEVCQAHLNMLKKNEKDLRAATHNPPHTYSEALILAGEKMKEKERQARLLEGPDAGS